jgi:hypothetical protein
MSLMRSANKIYFQPTPVRRPATVVSIPAKAPAVVVPPVIPGLKRALLVGINYVGTPYTLAGCINDVTNMQIQLQKYFPMCKEYRAVTDNTVMKPTKANILDSLSWLVSGLKAGENVMFHYSGHGGLVRDTNGDELTGQDSCIYPINGSVIETITDDEIRTALANKIPVGCKCFVVLDACHTGTAVDLRCMWQATGPNTLTYAENSKYTKTAGNILFLSGCQDRQTAADTVDVTGKPCGALTMALLDTWKQYGAAIKTKYLLWDVRHYLRSRGYPQVPQLSTGYPIDMNVVFDLGKA